MSNVDAGIIFPFPCLKNRNQLASDQGINLEYGQTDVLLRGYMDGVVDKSLASHLNRGSSAAWDPTWKKFGGLTSTLNRFKVH